MIFNHHLLIGICLAIIGLLMARGTFAKSGLLIDLPKEQDCTPPETQQIQKLNASVYVHNQVPTLVDTASIMITVRKCIYALLQQNRPRHEDAYNRRHRTKTPPVSEEQLVMQYMPIPPAKVHVKMHAPWNGPYRIIRVNNTTITAHHIDTPQKVVTFSIDESKRFFDEYSSSRRESEDVIDNDEHNETMNQPIDHNDIAPRAAMETPSLGTILANGKRRSARLSQPAASTATTSFK